MSEEKQFISSSEKASRTPVATRSAARVGLALPRGDRHRSEKDDGGDGDQGDVRSHGLVLPSPRGEICAAAGPGPAAACIVCAQRPLPTESFIIEMASPMVNVFGFWIGGKSLKVSAHFWTITFAASAM